MKRPRSGRRILPAVLLAALVCVAVSTGSLGAATPSAAAAADLLASNWSPAKGASAVAIGANITVKFNQDLDPQTINTSTFYVTESGNSSSITAVSFSYNTVSRVATINPDEDLQPGTTYVVTLTDAIASATGLPLGNPGDWMFTTDSLARVVTLSPAPGASNVPTSANITVAFDKVMDAATVNTSTFHLETAGGSTIAATVSLSADKLTAVLNPMLDLQGGVTYTAELSSSVGTETGVGVTGTPIEWSFTTVLAPRAMNRVPANGAVNQPVNQVVAATFNQDMDQSTLTTATFYVAKQGGTAVPATLAYDAATRTATLTPLANYEPGKRYQVTLSTAVRSVTGVTLAEAPVTWSFTVLAESPVLTTRLPENGATGVSVNQSIQAVFDTDLDSSTVSPATLYVQPVGGSPVIATVSYNASAKTVTIDPTAALENGKLYQVTVSAAVLGQGGLPVVDAPLIWFFTTEISANDFTDVIPGLTPYADAIAALADGGIITGFIDGTFRPNDPVSRQQFAKMIVLSLGLHFTGLEVCRFTDVVSQTGTDPLYPLKYVAVCAFHGITQGKTAKSFAPYDSITRQQLITMVARAAEVPAAPASFVAPFTSAQFSTSEHYQNARKAAYAGLLDGLIGVGPRFDFREASSRGECAELLSSLVAYED